MPHHLFREPDLKAIRDAVVQAEKVSSGEVIPYGHEMRAEARGAGPVDAAFQAIEDMLHSGTELLLYSVNNITSGTVSQGEVTVRLSKDGRIVNGMGADTDIVVASVKAYLSALSKMGGKAERMNPQYGEEAGAP